MAQAPGTFMFTAPTSRLQAQQQVGYTVPKAEDALKSMAFFLVGAAAGGVLIGKLFPKTQWPTALGVGTIGLYLGAGSPPLSIPEMLGMGLLGAASGWAVFRGFDQQNSATVAVAQDQRRAG